MSDIELKGRKNDELRRIIINFVWSAEISERDMKEDNAGIVQWEECSQSCRNAKLEIRGAVKVDDQKSESFFTALQNSNAIGTWWIPSNIPIEGYEKKLVNSLHALEIWLTGSWVFSTRILPSSKVPDAKWLAVGVGRASWKQVTSNQSSFGSFGRVIQIVRPVWKGWSTSLSPTD